MANNPYVNKVQLADGTSLIDLSADTAQASDVAAGKYFHLATGERVEGTASGGGGTSWETLKEGTFTIYSSSPNYMLINNYTTPFLENETYRITWGSETFVFPTRSDGGYSIDGYYVGNAGVVGGQDDGSGATFFIYRDQASRAVAAVTDPAGSKFLRIEKQVSSGGGGNYQTKTGITPTTSSQTITADSGYDALDSVQIDPIPSQYIVPSGNINLTANGSNIDIAQYATASVAVSGGASNVVTGTFKGTTTGAALEVTLNYSGSGYPVAVMVYPAEGPYNSGSGTFYSTVQRYASAWVVATLNKTDAAPDFSDGSATCTFINRYKSSASSATSYSGSASNTNSAVFRNSSASSTNPLRLRSATKMEVFIASNSYGFMANINYKYWVMYSS